MSVVVAQGVVEVTADAKGVPKQVARDIEGGKSTTSAAGKGMGTSLFKGVLGAWAAIGGVTAIVGFFKDGVSGASDFNETLSKSEAIFGDQQSVMVGWARTAATSVGLSKSAALDAAAGFGDMFTQIGFTGDAAADLSIDVVQAAADLGSFSNLETAEVTEKITAALRGQYEGLQAVIPNISATRVQNEALAATGKESAAELTKQEKATATLAIIQKDGSRAMGDFARTSDGAANKAKIVSARLEDQSTALGQSLLPAWSGFLSFVNDKIIPAFTVMVDWITDNGETIKNLGIVIGIAGGAWLAYATAIGVYNGVSATMRAVTVVATAAQWLLNVAMTANPIGLIVVAIAALVAGLVYFFTQTELGQEIWQGFMDILAAAWTKLKPVFEAIGAIFTWLWDWIILPYITLIMLYIGLWAAVFTWLWEVILLPIFNALGAVFTWIWETIIEPIVDHIKLAIKAWGIVFQWLFDNVIDPVVKNVAASFKWVWENGIEPIIDFISGAIDSVGSTVETVFGGIADFVGSAFQSALDAVRGPINGIIGLVNSAIGGINSLSVTIPDWVPVVGGQTWGLNIPRIPTLARGSHNAPDTFIAGERGPELITGGGGARVYSNADTRSMLTGGGGDTIRIDNVTLDAHNVDDFMRVVELVRALPQVARSGRVRVGG